MSNDTRKRFDWLRYVLHAAIVVGLVIAATKYLNGGQVLAAFGRFDYLFAPFLVALAATYLALMAWRFVWLMRPVSELPWGLPFRAYLAGQPITLLPGGVAARAGLMKQAGVSVSRSAGPVALSSILDQVVFIAFSLLAALFFPAARGAAFVLLGVVILVVLVLAVPLARSWVLGVAAWLARRFRVEGKWEDFLHSLGRVVTARVMLITLGITVVAFSLKVVMLDLTLRGLGLSLAYPHLFLVYMLPTMLGRYTALPAGVGVTEASMVGFLVAISGVDADTATAATILFRVATVVLEAVLGAVVYFFFWRGDREGASRSDQATSEIDSGPSKAKQPGKT